MYNVSYGNFAGLFIEAIKELKKEHVWMNEVSSRTSRNVVDDLELVGLVARYT